MTSNDPSSVPFPGSVGLLTQLAGLLLDTRTFSDLLQGVTELGVRTVPRATTIGITLAERGRVYTVATADELATQLDERQYEQGTGPCLEAMQAMKVVQVDDFAAESRWGAYPSTALAHGIHSSRSIPMLVAEQSVGVVNFYSDAAGPWDPEDRRLSEPLAGQATVAVTAALRNFDEPSLADHLRVPLESRTVIDQAIGIIMGQSRCDATTAFAMLRSVSQRRNIKLRDVAAELVAGISAPPSGR